MLLLISYTSVATLGDIKMTLRRQESRTADQTKLAIIGATIAMIDQAQSIPSFLAVRTLELADDCLGEIGDEYVFPMRQQLSEVAAVERSRIN